MAMTIKDNFLATIHGEKADRFVNQYEYLQMVADPIMKAVGGFGFVMEKGTQEVSQWGVTVKWDPDAPGPIPIHNDELTVIKDITKWQDYVKAPEVIRPESEWAPVIEEASKIDRDQYLLSAFTAPGIFEKMHYLMGMEEAFINLYEEPEAMRELADFIGDWELALAKEQVKHLHPDAVFHHDDWGSSTNSFMSPEMFDELLLPAYKKLYHYYNSEGVIVVHHSDSYAANLVPEMIEMGVDVWQGCLSSNDIPSLIKEYGGKITFMGGIDSTKIDHPGWSREEIFKVTEQACRENGTKYYIPCNTMGGPESIYPGVYETVTEAINEMSKKMF